MNDATGMPQSAVVIGGSSEIAAETLKLLARRRLRRLLLAGRNEEAMTAIASELSERGVEQAECVRFDLVDQQQSAGFVAKAFEVLGEVDIVLLAAGDLGTAELDELDGRRVEEMLASNFTGQAVLALEFAKEMRKRGTGRLVLFSSVAGVRVRRQNFVYGAAKAGLDGFAMGLAEALGGSGVSVMLVRPGFVHTKMTAGHPPAPFAIGPLEVAEAILSGLEEDRTVVWVPPVLRGVFGLLRLLPQSIWRRLPG